MGNWSFYAKKLYLSNYHGISIKYKSIYAFVCENMEDLSIYFLLGLIHSQREMGFIFVIVDKFSQIIYFIHCKKINNISVIVQFFF